MTRVPTTHSTAEPTPGHSRPMKLIGGDESGVEGDRGTQTAAVGTREGHGRRTNAAAWPDRGDVVFDLFECRRLQLHRTNHRS